MSTGVVLLYTLHSGVPYRIRLPARRKVALAAREFQKALNRIFYCFIYYSNVMQQKSYILQQRFDLTLVLL